MSITFNNRIVWRAERFPFFPPCSLIELTPFPLRSSKLHARECSLELAALLMDSKKKKSSLFFSLVPFSNLLPSFPLASSQIQLIAPPILFAFQTCPRFAVHSSKHAFILNFFFFTAASSFFDFPPLSLSLYIYILHIRPLFRPEFPSIFFFPRGKERTSRSTCR